MRRGSLAGDWLNACALPTKSECTLEGMAMRACAAWIAVTASPSDSPSARLYEIVTAGNCPWGLVTSGAVGVVRRTIALIGTRVPVAERAEIRSSTPALRASPGLTPRGSEERRVGEAGRSRW